MVSVSSGAVTVNADCTVQVLAEEAHPLDRFDAQVGGMNLMVHFLNIYS